jgi:hypothetical protein
LVHCGQLILCGERNYAIALSVEVWVGCDKEYPDPLLEKHSESRAQFGIVPLSTRDGAAILSQPGWSKASAGPAETGLASRRIWAAAFGPL